MKIHGPGSGKRTQARGSAEHSKANEEQLDMQVEMFPGLAGEEIHGTQQREMGLKDKVICRGPVPGCEKGGPLTGYTFLYASGRSL